MSAFDWLLGVTSRININTRTLSQTVLPKRLRIVTLEHYRYATGFLPLKIPLACILNIPLCFVPFSDRKIIRTYWMPGIRNRLEHKATVRPGSESYKI